MANPSIHFISLDEVIVRPAKIRHYYYILSSLYVTLPIFSWGWQVPIFLFGTLGGKEE